MVFKRRSKRSYWQLLSESVWPRGGWTRAFYYVTHRVRRLPDHPDRIARGVAAGVFTSFTPFFGFHFLTAFALAKAMRGNVLASLLATFVGNPITFPIIALVSMKIGHVLLGTEFDEGTHATLFGTFMAAGEDLKHNFFAIFTPEETHWSNLYSFWTDIFLPYAVGGIAPGVVAGLLSYYLSEPIISAYQSHRRKRLKARLEKLRAKLHARQEEAHKNGNA